MNINFKLTGVEETVAKFQRAGKFTRTKAAVNEAGLALQKALREYPAERHGPPIFSRDKEKRLRQLRWLFYAHKAGILPYRRTRTLARGWQYNYRISRSTMTATVENSVPYAPLVQQTGRQVLYHRITGWKTSDQIAKEQEAPTVNIIFNGVVADLNS